MKKILLTTLLTLGLSTAVQAQSVVTLLCDQAKKDSGDSECQSVTAEVFADGSTGNETSVHSVGDITSTLTHNDEIKFTVALGVDNTVSGDGESVEIDGVTIAAQKSKHDLGTIDLSNPIYQNGAQAAREGRPSYVECTDIFKRDESNESGKSLDLNYDPYGTDSGGLSDFCVFQQNPNQEPVLYVTNGNAFFFDGYRGPRAVIEFNGTSTTSDPEQFIRLDCSPTMYHAGNSNLVEDVECPVNGAKITVSHTGARFKLEFNALSSFHLDDIESLSNRNGLIASEIPVQFSYTPDFTTSLNCTSDSGGNTTCSRQPNS